MSDPFSAGEKPYCIINAEHDGCEAEYRIQLPDKKIKYLVIPFNILPFEISCNEGALIQHLPPLPPGEWKMALLATKKDETDVSTNTNADVLSAKSKGQQTCNDNNTPTVFWTNLKTALPSIRGAWHENRFEYSTLMAPTEPNRYPKGHILRQNVFILESPLFSEPVMVKFAATRAQIAPFTKETQAYKLLLSRDVGPKFLGHVTEEGRVIGFVLEFVQGRVPGIEDREACETALEELHALGLKHGDLELGSFVVREDGKGVVLLGLKSMDACWDDNLLKREMRMVELVLGNGRPAREQPIIISKEEHQWNMVTDEESGEDWDEDGALDSPWS